MLLINGEFVDGQMHLSKLCQGQKGPFSLKWCHFSLHILTLKSPSIGEFETGLQQDLEFYARTVA
jgi:hypothetical protein